MGIASYNITLRQNLIRLLTPVFLMLSAGGAHAFSLQFSAIASPGAACTSTNKCTVPGGNTDVAGLTTGFNDGSRFIQEKVYIGGVNYFHVVVGSPDTNFALESYVTTDNTVSATVQDQASSLRAFSPYSGGNEKAFIGNINVSAGNLGNNGIFGNSKDPLGVTINPASGGQSYDLSGTGTTDPRRVALRMLVSDADVTVEVLKPLLDRKPLITQTTSDSEMSALFQADMRGLSYAETTRAAPIINSLTLSGAKSPAFGAADFDMSQTQRSYVTAGRYSYQAGQGWLIRSPDGAGGYTYSANPNGWDVDNSFFDEGSYTYSNGTSGFNVKGVKWESFFDYGQNASYCTTGNRVSTVCPGR